MEDSAFKISYEFRCDDGDRKAFTVHIDKTSLALIRKPLEIEPEWTRLEHEQCECCPLDVAEHPYCPAAVNIADVVNEFKDKISSQECKVRCKVPERTYFKKTSLTEGLYSLLGVIIATSGCPVMSFFKPMARFHLPFTTGEEATVRSAAFFLLGRYIQTGGKESPVDAIKRLEDLYNRVKLVNEGLFARITRVSEQDADKNAIVMFHSLSQLLTLEMDSRLESIADLFQTE